MNIKPISFNPRYSVSDDGRVFGVRGTELATTRWNSEHKIVRLTNPHKKSYEVGYQAFRSVHVLVANAFLGSKPFAKAEIRHLNDIPTDNRVENLAWGTRSENSLDRIRNGINPDRKGSTNGNAKLSEDDIIDIRILRKFGASQPDLGRIFNITQVQVSTICLGKQWKHIKEGL